MTGLFSLISAIIVIKSIQLIGKILCAILFKTHHDHIQIGFSPKLFSFNLKGVRFDIGWIIPLPFLLKYYSIENGEKHPLSYPWQFYQVNWWKRLIATFGTVYLLMPIAIFIFSWREYNNPETYISKEELNKYGIYAGELGEAVGFETGDRILSVNGQGFTKFKELIDPKVLIGEESYYEVLRSGEKLSIEMPSTFLDDYSIDLGVFIAINEPFTIGGVLNGSTADIIGLKKGDQIVQIANDTISSFPQIKEVLNTYSGDSVNITFKRDDVRISKKTLIPWDGKLGFAANTEIKVSTDQKTISESLMAGTKKSFDVVYLNLKAFSKIFGVEVSSNQSVRGPVAPARIFGDYNPMRFWSITAMLMMITFFANLLPFPTSAALQLIPLAYEKITKKQLTLSTFHKISYAPYFLLLALLAFSVASEIYSLVIEALL